MHFSKQGFTTSMFKWIFAFIVGALFLIFFVNFAFQQQRTSGLVEDRELLFNLEDQLFALTASDVATKTIDLHQDTTLRYDCASISHQSYRKTLPHLLFAPELLRDTELFAFTHPWKFPFHVGHIAYLADKHTKSLIIYDSTSLSLVESFTLPTSFNIQLVDVANFNPSQLRSSFGPEDKLTLVFFTAPPRVQQLMQQLNPQTLHIIVVDPSTAEATIHTRTDTITTFHLDEALLYGLIIAPDHYACVHEKALERLQRITSLYNHKVDLLIAKTSNKPACQDLLYEGKKLLTTFATLNTNKPLQNYARSLTQHNTKLEHHDCPTIY